MPPTHLLSSFWSAALGFSGRVDFSVLRGAPGCSKPVELLAREQDLPPSTAQSLLQGSPLQSGAPFLTIEDQRYPDSLARVPYAPPVLFYRGSLERLADTCVAVVGSRQCTQRGRRLASAIARTLSRSGCTTVSGLAYGIDEAVHSASLPSTVGVLAQGLEARMTLRQERLCSELLDAGGLLVSEFPPSRPARKWSFLQRNRIIAALASAVVVVEAGSRSGALNTARHAVEAGRDVYAVPWSTFDEQGAGCLDLIGKGAMLLRDPGELLDAIGVAGKEEGMLDMLSKPRTMEELCVLTGRSRGEVIRQLSKMLLEGIVVQTADSRYRQR